jgi:RimJ/RimL family protein N-acetyltransferase
MLKLKKFNTSNITKKYLSWLKDEEIIKFTTINPKNKDIDILKYVKKHQHNKNEKLLRIIFKKKHVGNLRIHFINKIQATIAILIGEKNYHSKGIGSKSIKLAIKLIKKKNIKKIYAYVNKKNLPSVRLFKKNGFKIKKNNPHITFEYLVN